ncbi:hydroxyacid dehydrogenase (plasmid) [Nicoliella spurrieriana]|uniref:Hydroxyacid dehydrogenase n=1 Tax=Nicoliella spurrieriana TaxID=2925830 RepID=A0A976X4V9_9LACO|nr:NAD(P)-dependent oxidoreductase [Nicoliella spurrieriana]UQS85996.1 hydroxyacid dehydrogenase [Nicoliella spurrieriana]
MNILVGAPNANFDIEKMEQKMVTHPGLTKEKLFFANQSISKADLKSIDILIGYDQKLLSAMLSDPDSNLKWIQSLSVGIDYYPLAEIKNRGVRLATVKGIHSEPIAETVTGMILNQFRNLSMITNLNRWEKPTNPFKILPNKTAVIYGTGAIGSRVAEILKVLNVNTIGINHSGHQAKFFDQTFTMDAVNDQIKNAEIIINSLPLMPATNKFFNQPYFEQFTRQPLFINVGRGGSVVTEDLINALNQHQLGGASLDVIDPEPFPSDSPLWKMDNVFISPHIASLFDQYGDQALDIFSKNLREYEYDGALLVNEVNLNR